MAAKWEDARYGFTKLHLGGWLELSVWWSTSGGGYEWSSNVGVRGTKKYASVDGAHRAAETWARKALGAATADLPPTEARP